MLELTKRIDTTRLQHVSTLVLNLDWHSYLGKKFVKKRVINQNIPKREMSW